MSAGAPVNKTTTALHGATPLIVGSKTGCLPFVRLLLEHGADANSVNNHGRSAMSFAAEEGHVQILELLHEAGGHIDEADTNGITPVIYAAKYSRTECIDFLLSRNWSSSGTSKKDICQQVLVHSAFVGNFEVVDFMLNYPAVNCRAEINVSEPISGETAMTMAVRHISNAEQWVGSKRPK